MEIPLCPAQQNTYNAIVDALPHLRVVIVSGSPGMGRTTVLRALHRHTGGAFLTVEDFTQALRGGNPLALEETFERLVGDALRISDTVYVDDLHLVTRVTSGYCNGYPRTNLLDSVLTTLATEAIASGKRLVVGYDWGPPAPLGSRGREFSIGNYEPEDYAFLCRAFLGTALADGIDHGKVHRFATHLSSQFFFTVCPGLRDRASLTTAEFIEFLRSFGLSSNVDLDEVQKVELRDLKGIDEVIEGLEANVVLPLENDELTTELGLKPKRGVLLLGPPGTGKTTVGRALAHRLKGKFFLVDGTCIAGTERFYYHIQNIFEAAKNNAPSVLFIDDSDAIFESGTELGLYRYLLTMLDGLESASAGRVCVMLTAMEIGHLPPALLRSGRIELWLEMKLPDHTARRSILGAHLASLPASVGTVDLDAVASTSSGFTGADLKRLAEDGRLLIATERVKGKAPRPATDYFVQAANAVRANKILYAGAEERARRQSPRRGPHYDHVGTEIEIN